MKDWSCETGNSAHLFEGDDHFTSFWTNKKKEEEEEKEEVEEQQQQQQQQQQQPPPPPPPLFFFLFSFFSKKDPHGTLQLTTLHSPELVASAHLR